MARIPILLAAVVALALPASALAQVVPPGQSEADQYTEAVPDGKGNKKPDNSKKPSDVLTPGQIAELEALGADGLAAAEIAAATAPDPARSGLRGAGSGGKRADGTDEATGAGAVGDDPDSVDGAEAAGVGPTRDGLGGLLWVILAAVAVVIGGYAAVRWRARTGP